MRDPIPWAGGATLLAAYHAYGWHCVADNGKGDDAEAVCAWTFHLPSSQVTNTVQDFNDPYTWQCWRVTRELSTRVWFYPSSGRRNFPMVLAAPVTCGAIAAISLPNVRWVPETCDTDRAQIVKT